MATESIFHSIPPIEPLGNSQGEALPVTSKGSPLGTRSIKDLRGQNRDRLAALRTSMGAPNEPPPPLESHTISKTLPKSAQLKLYREKLVEKRQLIESARIEAVAKANLNRPNFGATTVSIWVIKDATSIAQDTTSAVAMVRGQASPAAMKAFSIFSLVGGISGILRLKDSAEQLKSSMAAGEPLDVANALLGIGIAVLQLGCSLPVLPLDAIKIVLTAIGTSIPAVLTKIRHASAGLLGGGLCLLLGIMCGLKLILEARFLYQYRQDYKDKTGEERSKAKLAFLLKQFEITKEEKSTLFKEVCNDQEALNEIEQLETIDPELDAFITEQSIKYGIENDPRFQLYRPMVAALYKERLAAIDISKRKASAMRVLGDEAIYQLKRELNKPDSERLLTRLENGDLEAAAEIDKLLSKTMLGVALTTVVFSLAVFASILGVITSIAGIFITGGTGALVLLGISIVASLSWIACDGISLLIALKREDPGKYEKLVMAITSAILMITAVVGFFLTSGLGALALMLVLTFIWLFIMVVTWLTAHYKSRKLASAS